MRKYRYTGQGVTLRSSQGYLLRLPDNVPNPSSDLQKEAITILLPSLAQPRLLLRGVKFRAHLTTANTLVIYTSGGVDGPMGTAIFTSPDLTTLGLTINQPALFYFNPVYLNADGPQIVFEASFNGVKIAFTQTTQAGGYPLRGYPYGIGGTDVEVQSGFTVLEYFAHIGAALSRAQQFVLHNNGRGCNVRKLRFLGNRLLYLVRFEAQHYTATTHMFAPVVGPAAAPALLTSLYYHPEYATTNALFFDGQLGPYPDATTRLQQGDKVLLASGAQVTAQPCAEYTYELDAWPEKAAAALPAVGSTLPAGGSTLPIQYDNADTASVLSAEDAVNSTPAFSYSTWLIIQTNGIAFGVYGPGVYYTLHGAVLLSYAVSLASWTRIAIRVVAQGSSQVAELYLNGVLVATSGPVPPMGYYGGSTVACQTYPTLPLGIATYGPNGNRGGSYRGYLRNYRVWGAARSVAALTGPDVLPAGNEADLLLYWPLSRTSPTSTVIADAGPLARNGVLTNYVLTPTSPSYVLRAGNLIR